MFMKWIKNSGFFISHQVALGETESYSQPGILMSFVPTPGCKELQRVATLDI